jgi:hypothetical protein
MWWEHENILYRVGWDVDKLSLLEWISKHGKGLDGSITISSRQ